MSERGRRTRVVGVVISDRMAKTITVQEARLVRHPRYGKYVKMYTKYRAHDENREARLGDTVELIQCRRLSKTKFFRLARIVARGRGAAMDAATIEPSAVNEALKSARGSEPAAPAAGQES